MGLGNTEELWLDLFWVRRNLTQEIRTEGKKPRSLLARAGKGERLGFAIPAGKFSLDTQTPFLPGRTGVPEEAAQDQTG